jgi:hypothetical protein
VGNFDKKKQMKSVASYIAAAFRIDPASGAPIIETQVERLDNLFNRLDRAPFRRRDLSPDFKQFLHDCAHWVPLSHPIIIEVQVPSSVKDAEHEHEVIEGIRNFFAYLVIVQREQAREQRSRLAVFIAAAVVLLTLVFWLGPQERVLPSLVLNGLTVGGWVFLWEALSVVFIRSADARAEMRRNQRWATAEIRFVRVD